jgi:hypothetical protein
VNTIHQLPLLQAQQFNPFTLDELRKILSDVLRLDQKPPSAANLKELANTLNFCGAAYARARKMVPVSKMKWERVKRVRAALAVLTDFFEERKRSLRTDGISEDVLLFGDEAAAKEVIAEIERQPSEVADPITIRDRLMKRDTVRYRATVLLERERRLCDQFDRLVQAMEEHTFSLKMDIDERGAMGDVEERRPIIPDLDNGWHDLAEFVATAFRLAMAGTNEKPLGASNDGPVARFVAAVIPKLTGETPSVAAVGKHLGRAASRRTGTSPD